MTIATRFTADQLVICPDNGGFKVAANKCIELCKLLQHVYPDIRFAVDGEHRDASNKVDYRGRIDVYAGCGERAGRIDVDVRVSWAGGDRFTFEGKYVDKGEARYYGDGKVWRKDPIKLVQAIQAQNCIRGRNAKEQYKAALEEAHQSAYARLYSLNKAAGRLEYLSKQDAVRAAITGTFTVDVLELVAEIPAWRTAVDAEQVALDETNAKLAIQFGVEQEKLELLWNLRDLASVLGVAKKNGAA